jgi:hypothetical protein
LKIFSKSRKQQKYRVVEVEDPIQLFRDGAPGDHGQAGNELLRIFRKIYFLFLFFVIIIFYFNFLLLLFLLLFVWFCFIFLRIFHVEVDQVRVPFTVERAEDEFGLKAEFRLDGKIYL